MATTSRRPAATKRAVATAPAKKVGQPASKRTAAAGRTRARPAVKTVKSTTASAVASVASNAQAVVTASTGAATAATPMTMAPAAPAAPKPGKPAKAPKAVRPQRAEKVDKTPKSPKKNKLVRDSFTMPESDFKLIAEVKKRALALEKVVKKSEVLRAGLKALQGLPEAQLKALFDTLPVIKTGRPKKAG